jgi:hypothetical protein
MLNNVFLNPENRIKQLERVIISNKMNETNEHTRINKYNPDVLNNYNKLVDKRNNNIFTITNKPYKNIINNNNNNNITKSQDLSIDIRQSDKNLLNELDELSNKRNKYDNYIKDKFNEKEKNEYSESFKKNTLNKIKISKTLDINYNDHTLLKINTNDYLKKDNLNLNEDKQKYNDIVNSLLNEGLL